jgi:hypothetical protein
MIEETPPALAGRTCPLRYRYGPQAISAAPEQSVATLYVIGGLYGNLPALDTIEAMAAAEAGPVRLCFNGDVNWFNVDDAGFAAINRRVCCAMTPWRAMWKPSWARKATRPDAAVPTPIRWDAAVVDRSNRIHARLKATARRHPMLCASLQALPMVRRYRVGACRVGVVHGDAESLAGWRFGVDEIDRPEQLAALTGWFPACCRRSVCVQSHLRAGVARMVGRRAPARRDQ